jgi:DNA-binding transcriptional MerR regulator
MNLARYSISDLEKLTGIKAHTIRIWEKRYGIFSPERTDTNIRYYCVGDLQRLMNISFLNKHGFKISHISGMDDIHIQAEVARICELPGAEEGYLTDLIKAVTDIDEDRFERNVNSSILKMGFEQTFQQVVFPLLEKVGLLWQIGKISACQERFANNLIRHKLVVAIDGMVGHNTTTGSNYLLYLPTGQYDEINLLFANYLLRKAGHHIIYLGPSIPLDHLSFLSNRQLIDHVVVSLGQGFTDKEMAAYLEKLSTIFPGKDISIISIGFDLPEAIPAGMVKIESYQSLLEAIVAW